MGTTKILRDFAGWTSAHGIPHIGSAQNACLRAFWTIIFLASTGMFIFQMVLLIEKYVSYDVTVQTELKFEERSFPAVTVCNLNPYGRVVSEKNSPMIKALMQNYTIAIDPNRTALAGFSKEWGFQEIEQNDSIAMQSKAREHLLYIAARLDDNTKQQIVYTYKDFVLNCAYNTRPCKKADASGTGNSSAEFGDFRKQIDPIYGACYTFNFYQDADTQYKSTRAGPLYGLRLLLKSAQADYLPLTESAGVRVAVHGQDEEPFPDAFGYNAAAGFTTSFGIKYIRTKRLPAPYGNCTDKKDDSSAYYYSGAYTVEGCFRSCFQKTVSIECGCADPRFNKPMDGAEYCDYQLNNADESKGRSCVAKFSNNSANSGNGGFNAIQQCSCPQPCTESTYGVTVSTALWPSDVYTPPDCKGDDKPCGNCSVQDCSKWYSENTMLIEVYYERMNYQELSESEAYSLVNLISDMGGQLGLWMGISVITVVEFISLLVLLCLFCVSGKKNDEVHAINQNQYANQPYGKGQTPPPPYSEGQKAMNPYAASSDISSRYGPPTAPTPT